MSMVGDRIRTRREELRLSQDELAKKMGYKSRSTIAKIESGENDVVQSKIVLFAEALECTPAYLIGVTDGDAEHGLSEGEKKLIELFRLVPEDNREIVLEMIEGVLLRKGLLG